MRILYFGRSLSTHDHHFLSSIAAAGHEVLFAKLETSVAEDQRSLPTGSVSFRGPRRPRSLTHAEP